MAKGFFDAAEQEYLKDTYGSSVASNAQQNYQTSQSTPTPQTHINCNNNYNTQPFCKIFHFLPHLIYHKNLIPKEYYFL